MKEDFKKSDKQALQIKVGHVIWKIHLTCPFFYPLCYKETLIRCDSVFQAESSRVIV